MTDEHVEVWAVLRPNGTIFDLLYQCEDCPDPEASANYEAELHGYTVQKLTPEEEK